MIYSADCHSVGRHSDECHFDESSCHSDEPHSSECHFVVILLSFCCHFVVILVSFC
jgi:hypothetical protein